jgi:uncharacterized protein
MRMRAALLLLALVAAPAFGQQQANELPIMGSQATEETAPPTDENARRVLVIGDGLAGGLGAGLARMAEAQGGFEIVNRFQESSGLARPEVYDWSESLPKIMEGKSFTDAVILIGTNDRQEIRDGDQRYGFGSPEWIKAYDANAQRLIGALKAQGVRISWVALPPMGDAKYDADMQAVAAIQKKAVETQGGAYVDLRKEFSGPDGSYADTGPDDTGEVRKLRARDGITFFKQGNNRFGQLVLAALTKEAAPPALTLKPAEEPNSPAQAVPEFGAAQSDGTISTLQPEAQRIAEAAVQAPPATPGAPLSREDLPQGSAAEKLFTDGEADAAPRGRFDDFTYVKPAE